MSQCLPLDDRLTRNALEETIAENVDTLEEAEYAALALLSTVVFLVISTLVAKCVKKSSGAQIVATRNPRLLMRRNTIYTDTLHHLR